LDILLSIFIVFTLSLTDEQTQARLMSLEEQVLSQAREIESLEYVLLPEYADHAEKSMVKFVESNGESLGCGFFVSDCIVITTLHLYTGVKTDEDFKSDIDNQTIYRAVGYNNLALELKLLNFHRGFDLAVFQSNVNSVAWLNIRDYNDLRSGRITLALTTFGIGLASSINNAAIFSEGFTVMPANLLKVSAHHLIYGSTAFSGDSGGALLFSKDGSVLAMHQETVNQAHDELDVPNITLDDAGKSLNSLIRGLSQGFIGLRLANLDVQAQIFTIRLKSKATEPELTKKRKRKERT